MRPNGYLPFDSVDGLNWGQGLFNADFWNKILSTLNGDNTSEVRAAARIVAAIGGQEPSLLPFNMLLVASNKLRTMVADEDYIKSFDDPIAARYSIQMDIDWLSTINDYARMRCNDCVVTPQS